MAFVKSLKKIECETCGYTGNAQMKNSDLIMWVFLLFSILVSLFFLPVFIVTGMMLYWLIYKPSEYICPKCKKLIPPG